LGHTNTSKQFLHKTLLTAISSYLYSVTRSQ